MQIKFLQNMWDMIRGKQVIKSLPHSVHYGDKYIYRGEDANTIILERLRQEEPCLIARFGETELRAVAWFMKHIDKHAVEFNKYIKKAMYRNAGFLNADNDAALTRFCCEFLDVVKGIDVLGAWFNHNEKTLCTDVMPPHSRVVGLEGFYPVFDYTYPDVWTKHLAGKKVLVIHPFVDSITAQYTKRKLLFQNGNLLPDFDLKTLRAYQSIAGNNPDNYPGWFAALAAMNAEIDTIDFDIALVGAGAYGIFLGHHCKKRGKQAVHVGGALQILFGIMGKRWESYKNIPQNEHWIRPMEHETPRQFSEVEHGCYW